MTHHDAVVVGAGPNGLTAAVLLARAGLSVLVIEREAVVGGAAKTLEYADSGFHFDFGSAIHPLALASPFFTGFELEQRVVFTLPDASYAHPFTDGRAGIAYRDLDRTVDALGSDGKAWRSLFAQLVTEADALTELALNPLLPWPQQPKTAVRFGTRLLEQGTRRWNHRFDGEVAPAMLSGLFAHNIGPQPSFASAAAGTLLGVLGHSGGWPVPIGGSQAIANALLDDLIAHGGEVHVNHTVESLSEFRDEQLVLLDVSTDQLAALGEHHLPARYLNTLRSFRFGPGVAKVDFGLNAPVPWLNAEVRQTATVHLGGTRLEIQASEAALSQGRLAEHPFVLVAQPSLFDSTRAPNGMHTLWAYVHVPSGSTRDATELITAEIERYAPGFRDTVLFSQSTSAAELSRQDINFVGGDFASGATTLKQLIARPVLSSKPWATPLPNVFLCSSATVPGPGVHGMSGYHAARLALKRIGIEMPELSAPANSAPPGT